jgi:hypothetical protein
LAAVIVMALALGSTPGAGAASFARLDQPGPALDVAPRILRASLHCHGDLRGGVEPVLLVPATGVSPDENYSWNWERALALLDRPYCTVEIPEHTLGDLQLNVQYVVYALREMHARSGRQVHVLGHSQGGNLPRWALRFWPDVRGIVDDHVGWAPANHGTNAPIVLARCAAGCAVAFRQQLADTQYVRALNSRSETFRGISYTEVYTRNDQFVQPAGDNSGTSSLHGGGGAITNIAVQDVCPADAADHLSIGTFDPVAYGLTIDALEHPGPADPSRIRPSVCSDAFMPGVDRANFATDLATSASALFSHVSAAPPARDEPPLACYATATCKPLRALTVRFARIHNARLAVRASVTPKLDGEASIILHADGTTTRFTAPVRAGAIRFVHALADGSTSAALDLALADAEGASVTPRARILVGHQSSDLSVRHAAVQSGILETRGTIDPGARGHVVLELRARTASGRLETMRSTAKIRRGHWRAIIDLGPAGPRSGQLTIRFPGRRHGRDVTISGGQRVVPLP